MDLATMGRRCWIGIFIALSLSHVLSSAAYSGTQLGAKIVFHSQPWSKAPCVEGAALAVGTDCATYATSNLSLNTPLHVYLVVAGNPVGIGGAHFGITYDEAPGSGVDIFDWTSCGLLQYPIAGPSGAWPAAGSANRIVWSDCQQTVPPGAAFAQAVAGAFYIYAYGDDVLEATPDRTGFCYGELTVSDCSGNVSDLMPGLNALGELGFGSLYGWNPCSGVVDGAICGLSERVLDFGTVVLGDSRDLTVRIQDVGFGLGLPDFDVGPFAGGDFTIVSGAGHHEGPVQDPVDVTFRFTPTATGVQETTFEVDPCTLCPPLTLKGTGRTVTPVAWATWGEIKARYR
jgi:hypothetical protein